MCDPVIVSPVVKMLPHPAAHPHKPLVRVLLRSTVSPRPGGGEPAIPLTFPPWMAPLPNNFPRICTSELARRTPAIRRSFFPFYLITGKVACYPMYSDFELGRAGQKESTDLLNLLWEVFCNTRSSWCHFLLIVR